MPERIARPVTAVLAAAVLPVVAIPALSQTGPDAEFESFRFSSDIHARIDNVNGTGVGADDAIFVADAVSGSGSVTQPLGALDAADLDGYDFDRFSVDVTTTIGGAVMRPADVFAADGTKLLDAAAVGISDSVNIDAVTRNPGTGDIVFSIDHTSRLGGTVFDAADLIGYDGSSFSLVLDLPGSLDVDAAHWLADGTMLVSFQAAGTIGSVTVRDEDIVAEPDGSAWIAFTPDDTSWQPADLDALWADPLTPGRFAWAESSIEAAEDSGSVTLTVERTGGSDGQTGVEYETASDTALAGSDFVGGGGTIEFDDGETSGIVAIELLDDGATEGEERFTVMLTGTTADGTVSSPASITVIIRDDEDFLFANGFEAVD